jgi:porphobilinogen synthase
MRIRPRRNRLSPAHRGLIAETSLSPGHLILPVFVREGEGVREPVSSMPGVDRLSVDELVKVAREAQSLGIAGLALFPVIDDQLKDAEGTEGWNEAGLLPRAIRALKREAPGLLVITDVALDPYSSDGHDGLVRDGQILNDETLPLLGKQALTQARAGADVVAPSDMMDGRVGYIRDALDREGHTQVGICSYCVKYASAFYGPFRDALDSAPRSGDKKTYQMSPTNSREALREVQLDEQEGADWLLVKPGLPYLDVVAAVRAATALPVGAYHVSGEYAMLRFAAAAGAVDYEKCLLESMIAFRRAGADFIFTYAAMDVARLAG